MEIVIPVKICCTKEKKNVGHFKTCGLRAQVITTKYPAHTQNARSTRKGRYPVNFQRYDVSGHKDRTLKQSSKVGKLEFISIFAILPETCQCTHKVAFNNNKIWHRIKEQEMSSGNGKALKRDLEKETENMKI